MPESATAVRRALVLGAAGFLGSAVVRALLDRGESVTALLRGRPGDGEFAFRPLLNRVQVVRGPVEDVPHIRQILAIHEVDVVYQCAAGATASTTHALTRCALLAASIGERNPPVIVPLRAADAPARVKYQALGPSRSNVMFVQLPDLFGPGLAKPNRWTTSLFASAARGGALTPPARIVDVCDVATAATAMVDLAAAAVTPYPATGLWIDVPAQATSRELMDAVKSETGPRLYAETGRMQDAVRATLEWHRQDAMRGGTMPQRAVA